MRELLTLVGAYLRGMWRYRWRALLLAWAVCVGGWAWVYTLPDIYSASARVYVDTESTLKPLLRGLAIETDVMTEVNMMTTALLSRPQLEKVARATDYDLRATTPESKELLITELQRKIGVSSGRDHIFTISFDDKDRKMAVRLVQVLLTTFMEDSLGAKRTDSGQAQRFLEAQIRDHETRLTEAEDRLAAFKKEHVGMMPGEGGGYYDRLQAAMGQAVSTREKLRLVEERRRELQNQIEGETPVFGIAGPSAGQGASSYDGQIQQAEAELARLRLKYTDKHPEIGRLLETIETLQAQRAEEISITGGTRQASVNPLDLNPVYQQLRIGLSTAEVEMATLRRQLSEDEQRVRQLRELVNTIPEVEAELNRLNRDYSLTKARYEELVERFESARLSEDAQSSTNDIRFRIIEPPAAQPRPVAPNRPLLISATLVFALGLGAALAFFMHQIHPVFNGRNVLRELTGLQVIGAVTMFMTDRQRTQRRLHMLTTGAAMALLLVSFGIVLVYNEPGSQLAQAMLAAGVLP